MMTYWLSGIKAQAQLVIPEETKAVGAPVESWIGRKGLAKNHTKDVFLMITCIIVSIEGPRNLAFRCTL